MTENLSFTWIWEVLTIPFLNFFKTNGRFNYFYLISTLLIGLFYTLYLHLKKDKFSLSHLFFDCLDFKHWFSASSKVDYWYYYILTILHKIIFSNFIISGLAVTVFTYKLLDASHFIHSKYPETLGVKILYTVIYLLAYDFARYYMHSLLHRYEWLWEFHVFHHSAESLNPFTVYRVHPIENMLLSSFSGITTGIVSGVFLFLVPSISMFTLLNANVGLFVFHLYSNLRHTQTWLPFPEWLSYILLSPAQHQIHHSKEEKHYNKNMGSMFAFWDYLNGTLYIPKEKEPLQYGLSEPYNPSDISNILRIIFSPFQKIYYKVEKKWNKNMD
ncbi:MAG: sterol desaturase family protein [Leptospiraceae bacterium]|nr:sterol desaturase family protein [Leptospiraceae bacterium]MCP5500035.1 sterol desaturase family protein [Leptospiraceae bacterium]